MNGDRAHRKAAAKQVEAAMLARAESKAAKDESRAQQVVPLVKLPPSEWKIKDGGQEHFAISVYAKMIDGMPVRHWQKWSILDFPNDLFGLVDLVNAGLDWRYIAAIEQTKVRAAAIERHLAVERAERDKLRPQDNGVDAA